MWIKLLSGIIIFGTHLKRYDRSFGYYRRFEHILMFNTDFCATMLIIKSHIEYYCVVWGNSCNSNAFKIEKLQRRACKLILGNDYTTQDAARKQFSILSFEETVFIHKAKVMYELANKTAPIYLTDLFQMRGNGSYLNNSHLNFWSTSNKNFLIPKPKISLFKNSLSYSGALVWNSINFPYG